MHIPTIDLTDALASGAPRRQVVAEQIRDAAEACGFFYNRKHGIPQPLMDLLFATAAQFFGLPEDAKHAVALQPDGAMHGYEALGSQTLDEAAKAGLKESFQCGREYPADHPYVLKGYSSYGMNPWPAPLPELREACERYFDAMAGLSATLLELLALSIGLPETYFARLNTNPSDTLRLLWYPPQPATADARTFGAGAHTDWGALTILAQDANGGLEVQLQNGSWVPADAIDGTFIINLGDMIPRWTNGRYLSNSHQVINKNSAARHRQSIAFFADLDFEALIEPIPSAMGDNHPLLATPCTVGEHMAEMVHKTYG